MTIFLARHGETEWNRVGRWQGNTDIPLSEVGRAQARKLADRLCTRGITEIFTSDLSRARETAEIVAARLELPVGLDAGLREVDVGDWAGRVVSEIERENPEGFRLWQDGRKGWGGGESYEEMGERVIATVRRIAASHPEETVLLVTHGGSIRACRAAAAGLTYSQSRAAGIVSTANCELVELHLTAGRLAGAPG